MDVQILVLQHEYYTKSIENNNNIYIFLLVERSTKKGEESNEVRVTRMKRKKYHAHKDLLLGSFTCCLRYYFFIFLFVCRIAIPFLLDRT